MSGLGLPIIDETVDTTNAWLNEISDRTGAGRTGAYHVLRAGLHALRDRLTADEAVHLSQQLPTLVRGIFFEKWRPAETPVLDRSLGDWLATLEGHLTAANADSVPPLKAAEALFAVLKGHIDEGECRHLEVQLPGEVADLLKAA
jgi:uncharacterized protein (DUF2267 family)